MYHFREEKSRYQRVEEDRLTYESQEIKVVYHFHKEAISAYVNHKMLNLAFPKKNSN